MRKSILISLTLIAIMGISSAAVADGEDAGDGLRPTTPREGDQPAATDTPEGDTDKATNEGEGDGPQKPGGGGGLFGGGNSMIFIMLGGFVLLMFLMSRGNKKREAKRRALLNSLKKGDKVSTIGGIVGTVVELRENEVTLKVDENNNIRMKFLRRAISSVGGAGDQVGMDNK